jgi:predicted TIM-barrel fold metal-dependent hydrolase/predicted NBD/HSP70 family sugar kinase
MDDRRTLAVDIGGTGIKLAVLDGAGQMIGERVRVATPTPPVAPETVTTALAAAAAGLGGFDRVSVGFPGAVRNGRVLTAPNLGTELWAGFDLQSALAERWGKPVRVMNDADVQGFGAIAGKGVEMVLTLGTGAGTAIFNNGQIIPHLELAHHPVRGNKTYDEYVGRAAFEKVGRKKWNNRVARVIDILRLVVNFDHLYIGGGNARRIDLTLPPDVTIVPNSDGLTGGIALWRAEDVARPDGRKVEGKVADGKAARARSAKGGTAARARSPKRSPLGSLAKGAAGTMPVAAAPAAGAAAAASTAVVRRGASPSGAGKRPAPRMRGRTIRPSQPKTALSFAVPEGACDCHVHVFGRAATFPFAARRGYTPPPASAAQLLALQAALKLSRVVIVQPSVYGSDNSCTLDGMRRLGARARGVAVIDEATSNAALDQMHRAGIRGVRVNLATAGESDPAQARRNLAAAVARVAPLGWHVQVYTELSVIAALKDEVARLGVPIVFDHFGGAQAAGGPAGGVGQPGFAALLALVTAGHAYVKVSAAYRSSNKAPAYDDVAPLAEALIAANPDRILWGTDWPHPHAAAPGAALDRVTPSYDIDDGLALNQLQLWAPNAAIRRKILVANPARLYDF